VSVSICYIEKGESEDGGRGRKEKKRGKKKGSQTRQVDVYVQGEIELPRSKLILKKQQKLF